MFVEKIAIDSQALGRTVLELRDPSPHADFPSFEAAYRTQHDPRYCVCKVPIEDLEGIHHLEEMGFRFLELQLKLVGRPRERDTSAFPFEFSPVAGEAELAEVLAIAGSTFVADRFSVDPILSVSDPGVSGRRYHLYVEKSYRMADERLFKLVNRESGRIVGFNTHKYLGADEVLMFVGGVLPALKTTGLGAITDFFLINELKQRGVRKFYTHVSARNYPVMNLEIAGLGFKVLQNFAILRKIYP
ncbi:hypothetical protein [Geothrix sp. 21YS21S-2]|uniref:hypothetical protein n=1 Tax=Geothrix sp. 21YS21S-2 TaxID=3068893 RepID=UPI0027B91602|nr:hypothetical protein [Geothrix sp. 21YS21S-2]